jgi:hypothetical protein
MKLLLLFILLLFILLIYKNYKYEYFVNPDVKRVFIPRTFVGNSSCIKDDISEKRDELLDRSNYVGLCL